MADDLARRIMRLLSTSERAFADLAGWAGGVRSADGDGDQHPEPQAISVLVGWLVLVSGDAGSGDRPGAGRTAIQGRPLCLCTLDWRLHHDFMDVARTREKAAFS